MTMTFATLSIRKPSQMQHSAQSALEPKWLPTEVPPVDYIA
ncbi:hypothetical protein JCM19241_1724 [Vibrio ishigakensis]|uniref:Uncharacterized protein n=1 Tax=Vibrio ishigakensis TaxID=1481914 RepID=A0A0B8QSN3_9VIBR|nr:hypothetical protein JCM19241_1724 [Vibrio ishigakensis]